MIDWETYEMPISVVAAVFFDQGPRWLRYQESREHLVQIGGRSPGGDRTYTLRDVRRMAYALLHYGTIDRDGFRACIARIESLSDPVYRKDKKR